MNSNIAFGLIVTFFGVLTLVSSFVMTGEELGMLLTFLGVGWIIMGIFGINKQD